MREIIILDSSYFFLENQSLVRSLPLANTLVSLVLDLAQMVLVFQKHLQMTNIIMLENFYYYNFHGKSIPGEVLALGLLPSVFMAGHGPDGPGFPETPSNH